MKKILLILITLSVFANLAGAQEVGGAEAGGSISFFDIVASSGTVGIIIWIIIFTMWPVGIISGILSSIMSGLRKKDKLPFAFKFLITAPFIYILIGVIGSINGMLFTNSVLSTADGAAKAQMMAMGISNSMYVPAFIFLGMPPFVFFIILSLIILHFKKPSVQTTEGGEA